MFPSDSYYVLLRQLWLTALALSIGIERRTNPLYINKAGSKFLTPATCFLCLANLYSRGNMQSNYLKLCILFTPLPSALPLLLLCQRY